MFGWINALLAQALLALVFFADGHPVIASVWSFNALCSLFSAVLAGRRS